MKYLLKYEIKGKYLHYNKLFYKDFVNIKDLRDFLIENNNTIMIYSIYRLSDLTGK